MFRGLSEIIIGRLYLMDYDAVEKGLELPLAAVKDAVARFFSESQNGRRRVNFEKLPNKKRVCDGLNCDLDETF